MDYGQILSNSELRETAREKMQGNWGSGVLLCLVFMVVSGISSALSRLIPVLGVVVNAIIAGPLLLGWIACFVRLIREEPFQLENLFDGFSRFLTAFLTQLRIAIFTMLWTLLLIIPGIIAGFRYSMSFYIVNDNPDITATEALKKSSELMDGYKWKYFCLNLSFIGWGLLCILTLGIGMLWLAPYMQATKACFYENLKHCNGYNDDGDNNAGMEKIQL